MPMRNDVPDLQYLVLKSLSAIVKWLCDNKNISVYDLYSVVGHLNLIPSSLQSEICRTFIQDYKKGNTVDKLNEKHLFLFAYLKSEEFFMNEFQRTLIFLSDLNGTSVKKLTFVGSSFVFPDDDEEVEGSPRYRLFRPLYGFVYSLTNLTSFHAIRMCNDEMFEIFAECCPNLENVDVEMSYTLTDEGVSYLCGFNSASEAKDSLKIANLVKRKKSCTNIKNITLDFTMASNLACAILLQWCPKLEVLNVNPDINTGEVFSMIYGLDTMSYNLVTRNYALTTLRATLEIDDSIFSLIVQTCPNLQDVTLRCCGVERKDKNLLSNLLKVPITSLNLLNCNTEPLLWYLNQRGTSIQKIVVEHLLTAPQGVFINRTHIQRIIKHCPNLINLSLKMCGNISISPNVPYSHFGKELKYFTSLKVLYIEGVNLQPDDIRILIGRCTDIEQVSLMCQNLEILEDSLLCELLSFGCLQKLRAFHAFRPFLTYASLRRLLTECPLLEKVGPLSSWGISNTDREKLLTEIRQNNWNLNVESPEILQTYFF